MRLHLLVVVVALSVVSVPAAQAAGGMNSGGCPQGYVAFDKQTGGGGPPAYRQGESVIASGVITNLDAGVTEVALRWGAADGPELGRAAVDASGSWKGISFAVPPEVADGDQQLFYVAHDRQGVMLPGLPYPFTIRVGEPVAAPAREGAPVIESAAAGAAETVRAPVAATTRPPRRAPRTAAVTPRRSLAKDIAPPAGARSGARSVPESSAAPRAAIAVLPARRRLASPSASAAAVEPRALVQRRSDGAGAPNPATPSAPYAARPTPAPAAGDAPTARAADPARVLPGDRAIAIPDPLAGAALLALVLLVLVGPAAAGGRVVRSRRVRGGGDPATAEAVIGCPIEQELQDMIAAHRPEAAERPAVPLG